ncbi:lantibiotic modifying enzyme [Nonomuraea phyllanthi]|uniref:Lantibiotic modifying enzyme n=1 Tax=Nonomuraea phyllanthi TaxID=2219224 RepID=A0A5C4W8U5_9ACTN|nr:lanthionine synthetase C family protein [Nonomuraea phyllanthi]KAB8192542.1 lantibiotic modifying enzyme [Nonomuraea phyllanthi]QFY08019.1 lantibiotic modifying enzyme [Nonomuraea phyllanthi]
MSAPQPHALAVAGSIATALADPQPWVAEPPGNGRIWPQSLAGGAAGIALLHIERAHSGHGDPATAHAWLHVAASGALTAAANAGLFFGAPALAFVTHAAADDSGRYRGALARLDDAVMTLTRTRLTAAHARIDCGERPEMKEFDLIRGLAGLGAYHFRRHPDHPITGEVLSYLVRLTEPLPAGGELPPWWTSVAPNGEPSSDYPHGHGNLGMSHGICSALALLSLAVIRNAGVAGVKEAIEAICGWTDTWRQHDDAGPWWPGYITHDQACTQRVDPSQRPRPSWCYGISGTARAQQLAGMALGDHTRKQAAEAAMLATLRDPAQLDRLPEIGLCHGTAGLLQAAWWMAADAHTSQISAELPNLAHRLTEQLSRSLPGPELLDGAAGAALALHTIGTGIAPASRWDTFLLLA